MIDQLVIRIPLRLCVSVSLWFVQYVTVITKCITRRTMRSFSQFLIVAFSAIVLLIAASPVFAQVDLSGSWDTRQHEDALERGGGPEIGEYQGIPINDADRFRAEAWSASI